MAQDKPKEQVPQAEENPFCHAGMTCADGCGCAGPDGICHCPMVSARKCVCGGFCGTPKR
jgi:hypothetical protein